MTKYEKILLCFCGFLVLCLIWAGVIIHHQEKIIYNLVTPSEYLDKEYHPAPLEEYDIISPDTEILLS